MPNPLIDFKRLVATQTLKPTRYIRQDATFGLGALKRRPCSDALTCVGKTSEPASESGRYEDCSVTGRFIPQADGLSVWN
jgi:hypothetical protein